ncbi:FeoA family protein [Veronia pacifica]|uniref:Iron transporter FeoA n=1 Tax=Veronia pacifica TaxID=1080227 RepID=A0A1C3ERI7_9GAMM|nr:ferrous iron transport protein A [Veronia pacifica]ODA35840.1 iron transporter FeoA [Veronia pacifica]
MNLAELEAGRAARVISLDNVPVVAKKKLMVMGVLPNTEVKIVRFAPMGDPIQLRVRGFDVAVRKSLATAIEVTTDA